MESQWTDPRYAVLTEALRGAVASPRDGRRCRKCTFGSGYRFMVGREPGQVIRFACQRCNPGG